MFDARKYEILIETKQYNVFYQVLSLVDPGNTHQANLLPSQHLCLGSRLSRPQHVRRELRL
jgi:bifunctional DNase/RNase